MTANDFPAGSRFEEPLRRTLIRTVGLIGFELVAHAALAVRGQLHFYNGRG